MKVLLLSETLTAGGAETFVIRLANALAPRHRVILAIMHGHRVEPELLAQLAPAVRVERLRLPAERWLWRVDGLLRRARVDASVLRALQHNWLGDLVVRERPDVIHSHLFKADHLAAEVRRSAQPAPRHVITTHGDYQPFLDGHADPQMLRPVIRMRQALGSADAIAAVCRQHLDHLTVAFPEVGDRLHLIYNGYAAQAARGPVPLPPGKFLFGMVSRGVEQKGWRVAVEAFRALDRSDASLVLVGEGPAIARLRREAPPGVIFAGFTATPLDWIERFDVGLLPTLFPHESLPTAVIEYLACGKPVIATDVGEIGAMLRGSGGRMAGRLLPFVNGRVAPQDLARSMAELMDDPALRTRMSELARDAFARFDMERCVAAYEALYRGGRPSISSTSAIH